MVAMFLPILNQLKTSNPMRKGLLIAIPFAANIGGIGAIFAITAMLLSTFMSNTATANLLIPIVMAIPAENPLLLAASVALACSVGMSLPVSTPPNAIAFSVNILSGRDMVKAGAIISTLCLAIILVVIYLLL